MAWREGRWGSFGSRAAGPLAFALALGVGAAHVFAEVVLVPPAKDSTLIEEPSGALANGSGDAIFAGRIMAASGSIRRALLAFEVAAAVPPGSTVTAVRLRLHMSLTTAGPVPLRLLRVAADWGEGQAASSGGIGAPSQPGDATWLHRFYDGMFWSRPGGDFDPTPRAEALVDQPGDYVWGSTPEMTADVQSWLDQTASNFGWILVGDESRPQTAKRFASREAEDPAARPLLEIDYVPPCRPDPAGLGYWRRQCVQPAGAFQDRIVPCTAQAFAGLGLPEVAVCDVLAPQRQNCRERAVRKLAVLILNVCSGRLQTSCPVDARFEGCDASDVGDLLRQISDRITAGDCRTASGCAGGLD